MKVEISWLDGERGVYVCDTLNIVAEGRVIKLETSGEPTRYFPLNRIRQFDLIKD
jgi:hypothetical protein